MMTGDEDPSLDEQGEDDEEGDEERMADYEKTEGAATTRRRLG